MASKYNNKLKDISPLSVVLKFEIFKTADILSFQYSKYINGVPGSGKTEYRQTNKISDIHAFYNELENIVNNLNSQEELGIHSSISKQYIKYHMPLIDFSASSDDHLFEKMSHLQETFNYDIYLFKTGRSYHAYLDALMTEREWKRFLGHLLLLNNINENFVDSRWVGHSLIQGFSALRLSCNTPLYLEYPTFWQKIPKRDTKNVTRDLELF